jgi:hypothetical protein
MIRRSKNIQAAQHLEKSQPGLSIHFYSAGVSRSQCDFRRNGETVSTGVSNDEERAFVACYEAYADKPSPTAAAAENANLRAELKALKSGVENSEASEVPSDTPEDSTPDGTVPGSKKKRGRPRKNETEMTRILRDAGPSQ